MLKHTLRLGTVLLVALLAFTAGVGGGDKGKKEDEPQYRNTTFVPTADEVIDKMFEMAKVNKSDVIFDLGCGDNRIIYKAAKKFGCRGIGVEINPERIIEAMGQYEKYNGGKEFSAYSQLVELRHADALRLKDIGDASVVIMYMFPEFMDLWFPIAKEKLKPGTRILSHDYSWSKGWEPVRTETVTSKAQNREHRVIMWVVPEKGQKQTGASSR